jgi:chitinase
MRLQAGKVPTVVLLSILLGIAVAPAAPAQTVAANAIHSGAAPQAFRGPDARKRVVGYFTQWGIYERNYLVKDIVTSGSAAKMTHINYAFGNVRDNRCEVGITQASDPDTGAGGDAYADYTRAFDASESVSGRSDIWNQRLRGNWNQLKQLKAKYPNVKVLISLGGWTWSRGFSSAARPENRVAFVASCIDAYIKGNLPETDYAGGPAAARGVFDGIDIDWEYPVACGLACGSPEDRDNYTALLAEFRRQLDAERPGLLLSVAVGAGIDKIRVTDPGAYAQHLDYINVMTYDFHGSWEPQTNHHSALFASPADPSTGDASLYNSNDAIEAFLSRGVPAAKLNLGIGFYGRGWTHVPALNNGLYQRGTAAPGTYEAGIEDWRLLSRLGWPSHVDADARAQWIYNGNTFWSFDTPALVTEKMAYVKAQNLGGAFFWELGGDDARGTMVDAISAGLR